MQRILLAPGYEISRVIRGGWQMAGGHGRIDQATAIADMVACADAGLTTFDCADIYTGVEALIGAFRQAYADQRGAEALARIRVHTKYVPDLDLLPKLSRAEVERVIDRSLRRLGTDRLDLVQFHWWDYGVPGVIEAAQWLDELRRAGKIAHVGGTNFDTDHLVALVEAGVPLLSMQVQYSLLDRRPETAMAAAAAARGVSLLCYGTVAGGFLGDRWLGAAEPAEPLENRSLTKYKLIIDDLGGWDLFQGLLAALRRVPTATAATSQRSQAPRCWHGRGSRRSSWARATAPISGPMSPSRTSPSTPPTSRRSQAPSQTPGRLTATSIRSSATGPGGTDRS